MITKKEAQKAAEHLVEKLGRGWKPIIWENLGWHYKASSLNGRFNIHPGSDGFFSLLSLEEGPGGDSQLTDEYSNKDPRKVVQHQIKLVNKEITKFHSLLHDIQMEILE